MTPQSKPDDTGSGSPLLTVKAVGWEQFRVLIFLRDQGCVAPVVQPFAAGQCGGRPTIEHVKQVLKVGVLQIVKRERKGSTKAPDDEAHVVTLCQRHHLDTGWATSHRNLTRRYLAALYPEVWGVDTEA